MTKTEPDNFFLGRFTHPDKQSHKISNEYLSGWENLSMKIVSIKRNH